MIWGRCKGFRSPFLNPFLLFFRLNKADQLAKIGFGQAVEKGLVVFNEVGYGIGFGLGVNHSVVIAIGFNQSIAVFVGFDQPHLTPRGSGDVPICGGRR